MISASQCLVCLGPQSDMLSFTHINKHTSTNTHSLPLPLSPFLSFRVLCYTLKDSRLGCASCVVMPMSLFQMCVCVCVSVCEAKVRCKGRGLLLKMCELCASRQRIPQRCVVTGHLAQTQSELRAHAYCECSVSNAVVCFTPVLLHLSFYLYYVSVIYLFIFRRVWVAGDLRAFCNASRTVEAPYSSRIQNLLHSGSNR